MTISNISTIGELKKVLEKFDNGMEIEVKGSSVSGVWINLPLNLIHKYPDDYQFINLLHLLNLVDSN
jgi:hypothetical protein